MAVKWFGDTSSNNKKDEIIISYVHSGNPIVKPVSVDITTGIFTAKDPLPMGAGVNLNVVVNYLNTYPTLFAEWNESYDIVLQAIDSTTFYAVQNGVTITSYAKTIDLTDIVFEYNVPTLNLDLTGYPELIEYNNFRIKNQSSSNRAGWRYGYLYYKTKNGTTHSIDSGTMVDGRAFKEYYQEWVGMYYREKNLMLSYQDTTIQMDWNGSTWTYNKSVSSGRTFTKLDSEIDYFDHITVQAITNGGTVEIIASK